jgi:hypothetical protein
MMWVLLQDRSQVLDSPVFLDGEDLGPRREGRRGGGTGLDRATRAARQRDLDL